MSDLEKQDDTGGYIAAGYFLSRVGAAPDCTGTELRPISLARDHSVRRFFPDAWALSWCNTSPEERREHAAVFGIPEEELPALMKWADAAMDREFGVWNTVFTLESARAVGRRWLSRVPDVELWGLGLKSELVAEYCRLTQPPPQEPGFAPVGAGGTYEAVCLRGQALARGGVVLGHEILKEDWGNSFNSPESLHLDEQELFEGSGVVLNQAGLIDSFELALECSRKLDATWEKEPSERTGWLPWLLVQYPTGLEV